MSEGDKAEGTISDTRLQGSFCIKSAVYNVTLTTDTVSWQQTDKKESISVPIPEVLSVATLSSKPWGPIDKWCVNYVKKLKGSKLRLTTVTFTGKEEDCVEWTRNVQQHIDKVNQRPRKLLVIINPVSGGSNGQSTYKNKVAPIFQTANVRTYVQVTERAHHAEEVMSSYDLDSVHGIVVVGGDGLYHEVANGLIRRKMTDANLDYKNADIEVPMIDIRLGLIPCGTANGLAACCNGNVDVETAALSIVIGSSRPFGLFSVYNDKDLVAYATLLMGYGWIGDVTVASENRRGQGKLRYPITLLQYMFFKTHRTMDLSVKYLPLKSAANTNEPISEQKAVSCDPNPPIDKQAAESEVKVEGIDLKDQEDKTEDSKEKNEKKELKTGQTIAISKPESDSLTPEEKSAGWKLIEGHYVDSMMLPIDVAVYFNDLKRKTAHDCPIFLLNKSNEARFMYKIFTKSEELFNDEKIDILQTREFVLKLHNPNEPGTESYKTECAMNIDGEIFNLKSPEFHVKFSEKRLQMFYNVRPNDVLSREET